MRSLYLRELGDHKIAIGTVFGIYSNFEILKPPEKLWRGATVMRHPYALRGSSVP